ncbi:MAG: adenylosuccinate lyase [Myxococcales bacterium]|jgi:adenylosuccinate lyase|nr:adenylosuccinate lyase [Myxococcales bacterium]
MNDLRAMAISPLDGRYGARLERLASYFSEHALMKARLRVEVEHAIALSDTGLFGALDEGETARLRDAHATFDAAAYAELKGIEAEVRHDVKACELYLKRKAALRKPNRIHFGLTSEDVNNLAYGTLFDAFLAEVELPLLRDVAMALVPLVRTHADTPFPAATHGQPASPTTAGKELAVFLGRLLRSYDALSRVRIYGKLNGATGNRSAVVAAHPTYDWEAYEKRLVERLGLVPNVATTQVEDHDAWARWLSEVRVANNVVLDLCTDMWLYVSRGLFVQKAKAGEVGSSTMPHKVNPIHFENAEGNLQLSNAQLAFLADKLQKSRMQRDLSDSTVSRNVGAALAHHVLAYEEVQVGLSRVALSEEACRKALEATPELLAEPIQTILRLHVDDDPYKRLLELTRGRAIGPAEMKAFVDGLDVEHGVKEQLRALEVTSYLGDAGKIARKVLAMAEEAFGS